jgi:hypothetical protein
MTGFEMFSEKSSISENSSGFTIPCCRAEQRNHYGSFRQSVFERSEFPIAAHDAEQLRKQAAGGSLFFGFFLLAKQKKETRLSRESDR